MPESEKEGEEGSGLEESDKEMGEIWGGGTGWEAELLVTFFVGFLVGQAASAGAVAPFLQTASAHTSAASEEASAFSSKLVGAVAAAAALVGGTAGVALADEAEHGLHAGQYPWPHAGLFDAYDHASIRRGHQVYTQVRPCHGHKYLHYHYAHLFTFSHFIGCHLSSSWSTKASSSSDNTATHTTNHLID
jgi:hypothetical protein